MNDLNIGCFLSLVSTGSFAATAGQLDINKATVRYIINILEEELGVPLFIPGLPEPTLTAAGRRFAEFFQKLENDLNEAYRILERNKKERTLRLVVSEYVSWPGWFLEAVRRFKADCLEVTLHTYQASPPNTLRLLSPTARRTSS